MAAPPHRVVIVGGGAGGLELATRLGDTLGKRGRAQVTLIEGPHALLEAASARDRGRHGGPAYPLVDYLAHSHWHGFRYRIGEMTGLDRTRREVRVAPYVDPDEGKQVTGPRVFGYATLVIAVGSLNNDFGTPGVQQNAILLETPVQAERFHRRLVNACVRARAQSTPLQPGQLQVAIIGAGATGVELAAELHHTTRTMVSYGLDRIDPERDSIDVIEAGPRILAALPERMSEAAQQLLEELRVRVRTNARVTAVTAAGVELSDGEKLPAELVVWAAGVKAPEFLSTLDGLETNHIHQLVVRPTLQTTQDDDVFAIGDCAAAPWLGRGGMTMPPRAQAAHQQAAHLVRQIRRRLDARLPQPWHYRDFGSLVSLGNYSTVGSLMGSLIGGSLWIEGLFARWMYQSLYKMHELALHGLWKTTLTTAARFIARRTVPRVKLH